MNDESGIASGFIVHRSSFIIHHSSFGNGGSKKAGELLADFERVQSAYQAIEAMGVLLKDADTGLVDFPHRRPAGHQVLLCWRYGEPEVAFWHEVDAGFAGRQRL